MKKLQKNWNTMKKIASFTVIGILLCILTVSQAYAGYSIVWEGDETGWMPTTETARTEQASIYLFNQLFPELTPYPEGTCIDSYIGECYRVVPDNCVANFQISPHGSPIGWWTQYVIVCESGTWGKDVYSEYYEDDLTSGFWDVLLADTDNDGIGNDTDNCPYRYNPAQTDQDSDSVGDTCDTETQDNDGDGVDNRIDNCVSVLNFYQLDADNDTIGDVCDSTPGCGGCGEPACEQQR
jgi:hypothetical protein